MTTNTRVLVLLLGLVTMPAGARAQSVAARTPNLAGTWTAPPGVVQFNFVHRFSMSDPPLRKITNTPTFHVATGLTSSWMVGFTYGSNSTLVPAYPNEWELFSRARLLQQSGGAPLDVAVQVGYNVASEGFGGEIEVAREVGRLRLLAAGRTFLDAFAGDEQRHAVAAGAALRLTRSVSLAGDLGTLIDAADDEPPVWGVGLNVGVPFTPHSLSLHVSNVGTGTLEGASRGDRTRWGFEYTVPITLRRYARGEGDGGGPRLQGAFADASPGADTVRIDIQGLRYSMDVVEVTPGTTVVWTNRDPFAHSVTADEGAFDSGLIQPGDSFSLTMPNDGTWTFHCTPHPWMTGRVVVRAGTRPPDAAWPR